MTTSAPPSPQSKESTAWAELPWPDGIPEPRSRPPLTTAPSDGPRVARWIEANCVYGEGDKLG